MAEASQEPRRPLPEITELTAPFWQATKEGQLVMQRCRACGELVWCPRPSCVECGGEELEWDQLSGRGTVYSFTVIRRRGTVYSFTVIRQLAGRGARAFEKDIPYVIAWVDLEEGPRYYTNIVQCPVDDVEIGMEVEVVFDPASDDISLPKFKPR